MFLKCIFILACEFIKDFVQVLTSFRIKMSCLSNSKCIIFLKRIFKILKYFGKKSCFDVVACILWIRPKTRIYLISRLRPLFAKNMVKISLKYDPKTAETTKTHLYTQSSIIIILDRATRPE